MNHKTTKNKLSLVIVSIFAIVIVFTIIAIWLPKITTEPDKTESQRLTSYITLQATAKPSPSSTSELPRYDKDAKFVLTEIQQSLFDKYINDFSYDITIFKGVSAIDAAHVFIQCWIKDLWEGEYGLLYFGSKEMTKEEYKDELDRQKISQDKLNRQDYANIFYSKLNDGTFYNGFDDSGYISFYTFESTPDYQNVIAVKYRMNLNLVDEIWKVNFNKMLEPA